MQLINLNICIRMQQLQNIRVREQLAIDMPTRCSWLRNNAIEKAKPMENLSNFSLRLGLEVSLFTRCLFCLSLSFSPFLAVHLRLDLPEQMLLHTGVLAVCFDNAYCVLCRCGNSSVHTNNAHTHTHGHTHTLPKDLCSFGNCVASFCFGFNCH